MLTAEALAKPTGHWCLREEIPMKHPISGNSSFKNPEVPPYDPRMTSGVLERDACLALLYIIMAKANEYDDAFSLIRSALRRVCEHMGWPIGHAYVLKKELLRSTSVSRSIWYSSDLERFGGLIENTMQAPPCPGGGLISTVVGTGRARWVADVRTEKLFAKGRVLSGSGLRSAFAFPVQTRQGILAVFEFYSPRIKKPQEQSLELLEMIGKQLGVALKRYHAVQELRDLNKVLEHAVEGVSRLDEAGRYTLVSRSHALLLGRKPAELAETDWLATIHPDDREAMSDVRKSACQNGRAAGECRGLRPDGSVFHQEIVLISTLSKSVAHNGHYCFIKDISDRKRQEEQLRHGACHDALTNIPNRKLFLESVNRALIRLHREERHTFALLFLDLDDFKGLNDTYGHRFGDQVLVNIAARMKEVLRGDDLPGRIGGDEFGVLLYDINERTGSMELANRILAYVQSPMKIGRIEVSVEASIGIVLATREYRQAEDLLEAADQAMYRAKREGKGRIAVRAL